MNDENSPVNDPKKVVQNEDDIIDEGSEWPQLKREENDNISSPNSSGDIKKNKKTSPSSSCSSSSERDVQKKQQSPTNSNGTNRKNWKNFDMNVNYPVDQKSSNNPRENSNQYNNYNSQPYNRNNSNRDGYKNNNKSYSNNNNGKANRIFVRHSRNVGNNGYNNRSNRQSNNNNSRPMYGSKYHPNNNNVNVKPSNNTISHTSTSSNVSMQSNVNTGVAIPYNHPHYSASIASQHPTAIYATGGPITSHQYSPFLSGAPAQNGLVLFDVNAMQHAFQQHLMLSNVQSSTNILSQTSRDNHPSHPAITPTQATTLPPNTVSSLPPSASLEDKIKAQVEYYFSVFNLYRDSYLRGLMDSDGYVPLVNIATFKRLSLLTQNLDLIADVCGRSNLLEIRKGDDGCISIRTRVTPQKWVINPTVNTTPTPNSLGLSSPRNLNPYAQEFVPTTQSSATDVATTVGSSRKCASGSTRSELHSVSEVEPESHDFIDGDKTEANKKVESNDTISVTNTSKGSVSNITAYTRRRTSSVLSDVDDIDDAMLANLWVIAGTDHSDSIASSTSTTGTQRIRTLSAQSSSATSQSKQISSNVTRQTSFNSGNSPTSTSPLSTSYSGDMLTSRPTRVDSHLTEIIRLGLQQYEKEVLKRTHGDNVDNLEASQSLNALKVAINQELPEVNPNQPFIAPVWLQSVYGTPYLYCPFIPVSSIISNANAIGSAPGSFTPNNGASILQEEFTDKSGSSRNRKRSQHLVGFYPAGEDRSNNNYQRSNRHYNKTTNTRTRAVSSSECAFLEAHVGFAFDNRNLSSASNMVSTQIQQPQHPGSSTRSRSRTLSNSSDPDHHNHSGNSHQPRHQSTTSMSLANQLLATQQSFANHPSKQLLQSNGFTFHAYNKFRASCLQDRDNLGAGQSQEMHTLYRFWSFFLRENFNKTMYRDFRRFALEDASAVGASRYGIECLFRFYSYGLEKKYRTEVFTDFQTDVLRDYKEGQHKYGLEKFWAFLHYSGRQVELDSSLKELLARYNRLEDFRAKDFEPPDGFFVDRARSRLNTSCCEEPGDHHVEGITNPIISNTEEEIVGGIGVVDTDQKEVVNQFDVVVDVSTN